MRTIATIPAIRARGAGCFFSLRGFRRWRGLCGRRHANLQRIGPHWLGDILELRRPEVGDGQLEPALDLAIRVLRETDGARLGDSFQPRRDVDPIPHQVAVALLDDVTQMNAAAEIDAPVGRNSDVALDHRILNGYGASHRFDDAAELHESAVACALEHAAVLARDRRVDEFGAQLAQPREGAVLVGARHAAEADDVGGQDRRDFPGLGHGSPVDGREYDKVPPAHSARQ